MAPMERVQLIYVHITYVETKTKNREFFQSMIKYSNSELSDFITTYRDWVKQSMNFEISRMPAGTNIRYTEWRIMINIPEIFTMYGILFDKILLVLGEEYVYWTFYMNGVPTRKRIQGKGRIPLTYCACCINEQFQKIVEEIKQYILNKYKVKKVHFPLPPIPL